MTFKQIDINLTRFSFTIGKEGVSVIKKKLFSRTEKFVRFEEIGSEVIRIKERKLLWLISSIFFFLIALIVFTWRLHGDNVGNEAEVFWLSISAVLFFIYVSKRINSVFLVKDDPEDGIEFSGLILYRRRLKRFINKLLQQRDDYIRSKYSISNGLTVLENMFCANAKIESGKGLFLKKLTGRALEELRFSGEAAEIEKVKGICSETTEMHARAIVTEYQNKLISEGAYIFICGFSGNVCSVGLVATSDPYKIMEYAATNGTNYGIETEDIIAKCREWNREFGIALTGIGFDFCECEIKNKDIDYRKLATEVYEFCPDVVDQGTETVDLLEREIKKEGRIYLWWD